MWLLFLSPLCFLAMADNPYSFLPPPTPMVPIADLSPQSENVPVVRGFPDAKPAARPPAAISGAPPVNNNDPVALLENAPKPPSCKPGDEFLVGLDYEQKAQVAKRQEFTQQRPDTSRSLPYATEAEYMERVNECRKCGKSAEIPELNFDGGYEFHSHPYNSRLCSGLEVATGIAILWSKSRTTGKWKMDLHREMYFPFLSKSYQQVLDGGLQEHRGAESAETSLKGFISVVCSLYNMSNETGAYVRDTFWRSSFRVNAGTAWVKAKKEEAAEKKRRAVEEVAGKASKKQRGTTVNHTHTGTTVIFNGEVSPAALAEFAKGLSPQK